MSENELIPCFAIYGRVYDIDPIDYDTADGVADCLQEIEDEGGNLVDYLVQEYTLAPTRSEQSLVLSMRADEWLSEYREHQAQ